ncbi:MAG: hypothetical protein O3A29_22940 [Planctomycetota bacterium]|nr:hypothetical protein [Planctomycetota bacterium]
MQRPKVAALFDVCRHRSHANVILENFLLPYYFNGKKIFPEAEVVSFYADQLPEGEFARDISREFGIPIYPTIREALCLGGEKLAVDAVLSIVEGGDYPMNQRGQKEYPRKRFFDEIVAVMRESQRVAPIFNDKHLSYRWDWAREMYDTARQMEIPFMAGSSLPLGERRPRLEIPHGAKLEEALAIHGGPAEIYDIHGLELLQSIVESRNMGETGVTSVEWLHGPALWRAADEGRWSRELAEAAMRAEFGDRAPALGTVPDEKPAEPHGLLITYKDGLKGTVLKFGDTNIRWNFACRRKDTGEIQATKMHVGPWRNRYFFKAFSHAIQEFIRTGTAPYPVERTLLTTGILEAAMRSREAGKLVATPELEFVYRPIDFSELREMGKTFQVIDNTLPEPRNQLDRSSVGS